MKLNWLAGLMIAGGALAAQAQDEEFHPNPYLGQMPPELTPKLFAPGMVNTGAVELNSVFSPDGNEFFFTRMVGGPGEQKNYPGKGRLILFHSKYSYGGWSAPKTLRLYPDAPHIWAADMSLSPDGQSLYFMGPFEPETGGAGDLNIWVSKKVDGKWQTAEPLPSPLNTEAEEVYSSVTSDGSLYFTSYANDDGAGARDGLHRAQAKGDGGFETPVPVQIPGGNSVGDTFVAPDESYLIFSSGDQPGGFGQGDLYISFRQEDGSWGEPINMGPEINSTDLDYCPVVTPDGKYFFFSRRRSEPADGGWKNVVAGEVYWVSADVIERLRP